MCLNATFMKYKYYHLFGSLQRVRAVMAQDCTFAVFFFRSLLLILSFRPNVVGISTFKGVVLTFNCLDIYWLFFCRRLGNLI